MILGNGQTLNMSNGFGNALAPQALAETAPLFYNGYFVPNTGLSLETRFATYGQLYLRQPWVATVVNKVAHSIARLGVKVWDTSGASGNVIDTGPYARLMSRPGITLDPYAFWLWLVSTIEIYGEAYLLKEKNDVGRTTGFIPMHPSLVQIFRNEYGQTTYRFMGQPNELMSEDMVVPFRMYNPDNTMRGISRLEPLNSTLINEDAARRANAAWWRSMGRPAGVLTVEGKLNPEGKTRLREQWAQLYGGANNVGKTAVLENGTKFEQMQLSNEEMQYIDSRKLNREEVCAAYDIPPPVVHILDKATFSNITEQMRSMYRDTIAPRVQFIESVFDWYVGEDFNGTHEMKFDMSQVLRGDFETRARAHAQLIQSGIEKPSEARPHFDLNDAGPEADKLYANSAIQPLGAAPRAPSSELTTVDDDTDSADVRKYIRDIDSLIGRGRSLEDSARHVLSRNPHDEYEITKACAAILERTQ